MFERERERERNKMIIEKEKAKKKKKTVFVDQPPYHDLIIQTKKKNSFSKREYGFGVAKKFVCLELVPHGKNTKE